MVSEVVPAFVAPLAVLVAGAGIAYVGYERLEPDIRRLRDDPLAVRDAEHAEGLVELRGTVEPEDHYVAAPFTRTDCVAFEYEIEERVDSTNSSSWKTLASGSQSIPFRLADDTGSILIEPAGAELTLLSGWKTEIGATETPGDRIRSFLEQLDVEPGEGGELSVGPVSLGTGDRRRYSESRLDLGETVSVFGPVEYDPDAGGEWGSDEVDAVMRTDGDDLLVVVDKAAMPLLRRSMLVDAAILLFGLVLVLAGLGLATAIVLSSL